MSVFVYNVDFFDFSERTNCTNVFQRGRMTNIGVGVKQVTHAINVCKNEEEQIPVSNSSPFHINTCARFSGAEACRRFAEISKTLF
jgi:hypothetical protein